MERIVASIMCGNQLTLGQELQNIRAAGIDVRPAWVKTWW